MLRLFLRLYLILVLVLALFFVGVTLLPNSLLMETKADYAQRLAQGTQNLIIQRLRDHPQGQWPQQVSLIAEQFGYPLRLLNVDEPDLSTVGRERLARGQAAVVEQDRLQDWYLPLPDAPYVLKVTMGQSNAEHGRRMTIGTFRMIEERLLSVPAEQRPALLKEIAEFFWFPVSLLPLDSAALEDDERKQLLRGEVLSLGIGTNTEWFYRRLGETDQVLKLGPMTDPLVFRIFAYLVYGSLAILVALTVWLWVRPLWGGVTELRRVTAAFGRGELQARAAMPRRAPLRLLGETFNGMAERIQALVDSHRNLTNAVSHELRTPIARMRFGLEMLERADSPQERGRHLAGMDKDVGELEALVEELLAFARFEREGCEQQDLDDLSAWLRQRCHKEYTHQKLDPDCSAPDGLASRLDPRLMARALGNLLRNADKYAAGRIRVMAGQETDVTWIEVHDDGPGVPGDERERIFEPFTRLDRSRDRETGGHGLGLAIVRRILELHGGSVQVTDSDLGGACFRLQWPVNQVKGRRINLMGRAL